MEALKYILPILFSLFVGITPSWAKDKIKIGYFVLEPHAFSENGKHTGACIDIWEKFLAKEMDVEVEWSGPFPPLRLFDLLEVGEINAIVLLAKNDERVKRFDFPNQPFFLMEASIAVLKQNKMDALKSIDDLTGLRLGFFKDGFIPPTMRGDKIKWDLVTSTDWLEVNYKKLFSSRIDGVFNPESLANIYLAKKNGVLDKVNILTIPTTGAELYSVFSKKDKGRFMEKYNKAIFAVKLKEKYRPIVNGYL